MARVGTCKKEMQNLWREQPTRTWVLWRLQEEVEEVMRAPIRDDWKEQTAEETRGAKSAVAWQPSCQKIFRIGRKFWAS